MVSTGAQGRSVTGKNVTLSANCALILGAADSTTQQKTDSYSSGWNVGVHISVGTETGIGVSANGYMATDKSTGSRIASDARVQVDNGATLYRIGTIGKSRAAQAQFWSLKNPFTPGFADRYGISTKNVSNFNFIETSVLKPGTSFITSPAPGVSKKDGDIEVVISENGAQMKSFTSQ